jgi:hypothetical protein
MTATPHRRGLTLSEVLAVLGIVVVLLAMFVGALVQQRGPDRPDSPLTQTSAAAQTPPGGPTASRDNVLFVGNSYTFFHNMPQQVRALARAAGEHEVIGVDMWAPGGVNLERHYNEGQVRQRLQARQWTYVVLQEQSDGPLFRQDSMQQYGKLLDEEIKKAGARTVFYMTWARQNEPQAQATITQQYLALAKAQGARVAPVGVAWQAWLRDHPDLRLHDADGGHPNPRGAYLTACVFYATFYGKSPVGLPGRLANDQGALLADVPAAEAQALQKTAWAAVQQLGQ